MVKTNAPFSITGPALSRSRIFLVQAVMQKTRLSARHTASLSHRTTATSSPSCPSSPSALPSAIYCPAVRVLTNAQDVYLVQPNHHSQIVLGHHLQLPCHQRQPLHQQPPPPQHQQT